PILKKAPFINYCNKARPCRITISPLKNNTKTKGPSPKAILLTFAQNNKFGLHCFDRNLTRHLFGNTSKSDGLRRVGMANNYRHAFVPTLANLKSQRNRPQQRHMIHVSQFGSATFAENVVAGAGVGRDEVAHILDNAENGNGHS